MLCADPGNNSDKKTNESHELTSLREQRITSRMAIDDGLLVTNTEFPQVAATTIILRPHQGTRIPKRRGSRLLCTSLHIFAPGFRSSGRTLKSWHLAHWMITGVAVAMVAVAPTMASAQQFFRQSCLAIFPNSPTAMGQIMPWTHMMQSHSKTQSRDVKAQTRRSASKDSGPQNSLTVPLQLT